MDADSLFQIAGPVVLAGWIALLAYPLMPIWADRIAGIAVPLVLSVGYTALVLVYFAGAEGGFDSLANVMQLFTVPEVALAGWVHYLAFDLFVGAWVVRTARREGIAYALVLPCLPLCFMFGPAGFVAFVAVRAARAAVRAARATDRTATIAV